MSTGFMQHQFVWFTGVVEDRADPLYLNRVKVRCFGYHVDDKAKLPTSELPWATVMMPATSAMASGVGETTHGLVEGSWVVGFFRDGTDMQDPVVMGSVGGLNINEADPSKGFNDPNGIYPKKTDDTYTNYYGESDVNKAARGGATQQVLNSENIRFLEVGKDAQSVLEEVQFEEPKSQSEPQYPFNHVYESESGHVKEYDDTPNKQRIREHHRSGTFYEVHPDGTKVTKIIKDRFELVVGDDYVNVKGNARVVIEGDATTFIMGNYNVEVTGDKNEYIYGNVNQVVKGNVDETFEGNQTTQVTGNVDIDATRIDLN